jgi:GNAT superfamily N-acetyltransferase
MKYIYKITYPTGKIYIGKDLTGTLNYFGSADSQYIEQDFPDELRQCFSIVKEILWQSEHASDQEIHQMEISLIRKYQSNNPRIGYNKHPKFKTDQAPVTTDDIRFEVGMMFPFEQVLALYSDEGWINYLNDTVKLYRALSQSLCIICAYAGDELIGYIRCVGDGETVILIQDLIVKKAYKRQGIGRQLLQKINQRYSHVRQKWVMCDHDEALIRFYQQSGFETTQELGLQSLYKAY